MPTRVTPAQCSLSLYSKSGSDGLIFFPNSPWFEIIGEALYRLEKVDETALNLKIPEYRKIIGLRNIIAHGYDIVDDKALWDFVQNRIPELKQQVDNY